MEPEIHIRQGQESDAAALRELRLEALATSPTAFGADYETDRNRPLSVWQERLRGNGDAPSAIFLACRGDRLVGMTGTFCGHSSKTRHSVNFYGVYVSQEARGSGVGGQLIDACADWARTQGFVVAKLSVVDTNTAAIRCYSRCGFQVYGVEPMALFYESVYYNELLMAKTL